MRTKSAIARFATIGCSSTIADPDFVNGLKDVLEKKHSHCEEEYEELRTFRKNIDHIDSVGKHLLRWTHEYPCWLEITLIISKIPLASTHLGPSQEKMGDLNSFHGNVIIDSFEDTFRQRLPEKPGQALLWILEAKVLAYKAG